jgi:hypothetical protein
MSEYRTDYPSEPIGGDNPYYCCSYCKVSDPQINGIVENHASWCTWRKKVENEKRIRTFVVANGDNLDIIKDWIQEILDSNEGSTFKRVKIFIVDEKSTFEFEEEEE